MNQKKIKIIGVIVGLIILVGSAYFSVLNFQKKENNNLATANLVQEEIIPVFTDDNTNETVIIKSDQEHYTGNKEIESYFSVQNIGKNNENFDIQFYFPKNIDVGVTKIEMKTERGWEEINLTSFVDNPPNPPYIKGGAQRKPVPPQFEVRNQFNAPVSSGETKHFRAKIVFAENAQGEFWIEALGDQGGYGLLDPTFSHITIRGGPPTAISQVETIKVAGCTVSVCTANLGTATTKGELVVVAVFTGFNGVLPTIADNLGNTYTNVWSTIGEFHRKTHLYYLPNAPAGITSVSATLSSGDAAGLVVGHYKGIATTNPLDTFNDPDTIDDSPTWTSSSINTAQTSELLIGTDFAVYTSGANASIAASGNWTQDQLITESAFDGGNGNAAAYAHQIVSSVQTGIANTGTNPVGTSNNYAGIVAFKGFVPTNPAVKLRGGGSGNVKFR